MKDLLNKCLAIFAVILTLFISCKKRPFIPDYTNTGGFVIGRETCKTNETEDYWLIDLTCYSNTPQYGDTLILSGITYTNVVKVKTLDPRLKQIGMKVSFDFKTITSNKVITSGCSVANPITYDLKELFIINQFEIR
ncbi:MAG: hypothetical protein ACK4RX_13680 [Chitinophagaceae bacterium]